MASDPNEPNEYRITRSHIAGQIQQLCIFPAFLID